METETAGAEPTASIGYALGAGVASGLVAGVAMGVVLHFGANVMPLIGALYGIPTVVGGWIAHLVNSAVIGLLFSGLVTRPVVRQQTASVVDYATLGIAYAAGVGLVTGGIMLPVSLNLVGTRALPEPALPLAGTLGGIVVVLSIGVAHLVYGLVLGATFGYVYRDPGW